MISYLISYCGVRQLTRDEYTGVLNVSLSHNNYFQEIKKIKSHVLIIFIYKSITIIQSKYYSK